MRKGMVNMLVSAGLCIWGLAGIYWWSTDDDARMLWSAGFWINMAVMGLVLLTWALERAIYNLEQREDDDG